MESNSWHLEKSLKPNFESTEGWKILDGDLILGNDGEPISSETSSSLTLEPVRLCFEGLLAVEVSGLVGGEEELAVLEGVSASVIIGRWPSTEPMLEMR